MEGTSFAQNRDINRGWDLRKAAEQRWLSSDEILEILLNYEQLGFTVGRQPPTDTSNGKLYVYDRSKFFHFKADGIDWQKRKGQDRVREDFVKIFIHDKWRVSAFYTTSSSDKQLKRRCYREAAEGSSLFLMHYRYMAPPSMAAPMSNTRNNVILDFSPSVMSTVEQGRVLVVLASPLTDADIHEGVCVCFGDVAVPAEIRSPTALRCMSPCHPWGKVKLTISTTSRTFISLPSEEDFTFESELGASEKDGMQVVAPTMMEQDVNIMAAQDDLAFRTLASATLAPVMDYSNHSEPSPAASSIATPSSSAAGTNALSSSSSGKRGKRVNSRSNLSAIPYEEYAVTDDHNDHETERQNKIRLVERLTTLNQDDEWPDDGRLQELRGNELSALLERYIMSVVEQLVDMASDNVELIEEIDRLDHHGFNLMHYCCLFNQTGLIPLLLKRGVNCNVVSQHGSTPLHIAASVGSLPIVQILIQNGASLFVKDSHGHYPMHVAMGCGHMDVHQFLLEQGQSLVEHCPIDYTAWVGAVEGEGEMVFPHESYLGLEGGLLTNVDSASERDLFKDMFDDFSLRDKVAWNQSLSKSGDSEYEDGSIGGLDDDFDLDSVLSESDKESLHGAMRVMGTYELAEVSDEAQRIQNNVRSWLLRKNYLNLREAAKTLQMAWRKRNHIGTSSSGGNGNTTRSARGQLDISNTSREQEAASTLQRFAKNFRKLRHQAVASLMFKQRFAKASTEA